MAWASSLTTGKTSVSYSLTKGASTFHSAPAGDANFSNIALDWVPSQLSVKKLENSLPVSVYPNPVNSKLFIDFKQPVKNCTIEILDISGKEVYTEFSQSIKGIKNISLTKYPAGVYFISVRYANKNLNYRIVKKN